MSCIAPNVVVNMYDFPLFPVFLIKLKSFFVKTFLAAKDDNTPFEAFFDREWNTVIDFIEKSLLFLQTQEILKPLSSKKRKFLPENLRKYLDTVIKFSTEELKQLEDYYDAERKKNDSCIFKFQTNFIIIQWYLLKQGLKYRREFILQRALQELARIEKGVGGVDGDENGGDEEKKFVFKINVLSK